MQRYCTELTEKLLKSLDQEYNVVDMAAVVDVITALEKTTITKEVLEITRLGKYINELRRKTNNEALAKRAKDLVRRWRDMVLPSNHNTSHAASFDNTSFYHTLNGSTKPQSPSVRCLVPQNSVVTRVLKPQSPHVRDVLSTNVVSPRLSNVNEHSDSLNPTSIKQPTVSNHKSNTSSSSRLIDSTNQSYMVEAVPRTHSSNKRLRKEDNQIIQQAQHVSPLQHHQGQQQYSVNSSLRDDIAVTKKQRVNGENVINVNANLQVPSPSSSTMKERSLLDISCSRENNIISPKKRGRKKGSKSFKNQTVPEDRVKEKLASISRNPKLKTTQELLADLQARGSTIGIMAPNAANADPHSLKVTTCESPKVTENLQKIDDVDRITIDHKKLSTPNHYQTYVTDSEGAKDENMSSTNLAIKEILEKLPPIDFESIRWSDDEDSQNDKIEDSVNHTKSSEKQVTDADVDRLHQMCIESVNGNFQLNLTNVDKNPSTDLGNAEAIDKSVANFKYHVQDGTNKEFREWHEMLAKPTCDGQILHILPYVIID